MSFTPEAAWLEPQDVAEAHALPAPFYTHRDSLAAEHAAIFTRSWQLVGHESELKDSGDHVVAEIGMTPVIVVRGEDGTLRAFHNVCRHRAGPLATCNGRGARNLVCRYHGWTYRLDGRLRGAPEMNDARNFSVEDIRLPEAKVDTWQGLVFVALDAVPTLGETLAGVTERVGARELDRFVLKQQASYEIDCNWKVYVDNFLEGYHLPMVHPGLNRLLDYRSYVTETAEWHSLQWSPLETGDENVNFYGTGEALYYFIWPNTMLNILPGRLQTNRVIPLGVDRCRVEFDYYYPAATDDARSSQDVTFSDEVQHEDVEICEAVQRGLQSGSYVAGRLNPKRETGLAHFHELIRRAYRETRASR